MNSDQAEQCKERIKWRLAKSEPNSVLSVFVKEREISRSEEKSHNKKIPIVSPGWLGIHREKKNPESDFYWLLITFSIILLLFVFTDQYY